MNTLPSVPTHKLATACFNMGIRGRSAAFVPQPDMLTTTSPCNDASCTHTIHHPHWPRPLALHMQTATLAAHQISYITGMPCSIQLTLPQTQPLPTVLAILNVGPLRYFTHILLLSHVVHAQMFTEELRHYLTHLPGSGTEDTLFTLLDILQQQGTVAVLDLNPVRSHSSQVFNTTAQLRADKKVMEHIRPLLCHLS